MGVPQFGQNAPLLSTMLLQFGHWIMDMEITSIQTDSGMTGHILFIIILHNRSENVKAERGRKGAKKTCCSVSSAAGLFVVIFLQYAAGSGRG